MQLDQDAPRHSWRSAVAQECMIGYSDSGKDAGRLAAAWGLYEVQERLTALADEFGVHMTLFHGRGGTVGRGGGPAHLAVLSQPPGTIRGTIRVTVQARLQGVGGAWGLGVARQHRLTVAFGHAGRGHGAAVWREGECVPHHGPVSCRPCCLSCLADQLVLLSPPHFAVACRYTSAVLEATLAPTEQPPQVHCRTPASASLVAIARIRATAACFGLQLWRETMADMARISCEAYRAVVRDDGRFVSFFQSLTPGLPGCTRCGWPGMLASTRRFYLCPVCVAVNELGRMNIGSRPAKRRSHGSIDTLRAIPWIFAWTQASACTRDWRPAVRGGLPYYARVEALAFAPSIDCRCASTCPCGWAWARRSTR